MSEGRITRVVGALAEASGMRDATLNELVRVGAAGLQGGWNVATEAPGTFGRKSTSPVWRAATWVCSSGMMRKIKRSMQGRPRK